MARICIPFLFWPACAMSKLDGQRSLQPTSLLAASADATSGGPIAPVDGRSAKLEQTKQSRCFVRNSKVSAPGSPSLARTTR